MFRNKKIYNDAIAKAVERDWLNQDKAKDIYNKYASQYQISNDLSSANLFTPSIDNEKLKQERLLRQEEERLKEEQMNKRVQAYLQMTPSYLTEIKPVIQPKPISKFQQYINKRK
jgi:hypothetical protein